MTYFPFYLTLVERNLIIKITSKDRSEFVLLLNDTDIFLNVGFLKEPDVSFFSVCLYY